MTVRVRQSLGDRSGPGMNCIHVLDLCSRSGVFVVLRYHHWDKPCCQTFVNTPSRPWITTEILWWYCGSITASPLVLQIQYDTRDQVPRTSRMASDVWNSTNPLIQLTDLSRSPRFVMVSLWPGYVWTKDRHGPCSLIMFSFVFVFSWGP